MTELTEVVAPPAPHAAIGLHGNDVLATAAPERLEVGGLGLGVSEGGAVQSGHAHSVHRDSVGGLRALQRVAKA
jgi:hypothetical protein